jgi:hypothetical protein
MSSDSVAVYTDAAISVGRHVLEWGPSKQSLEFDVPADADILTEAVVRVAAHAEEWGRNAADNLELEVERNPGGGWHVRAAFGLCMLAPVTAEEETALEETREHTRAEFEARRVRQMEACAEWWSTL